MDPDDVMAGVRDDRYILGPTDKTYKVYVQEALSAKDADRRTHEEGVPALGKTVGKFYLQHLSTDQKREFVDLYNDGTMTIGYPGNFYVMPYFMRRSSDE